MKSLTQRFEDWAGLSIELISGSVAFVGAACYFCLTTRIGALSAYPGRLGFGSWAVLFIFVSALYFLGAYHFVRGLRIRVQAVLTRFDLPKADIAYEMPEWPGHSEQFSLILGERHRLKEGYISSPDWFVLPERGLYAGTIVFGSPGSSKTAGVANPYLRQFLEFAPDSFELKPAGLLMDYKASLVGPLKDLAAEYGRADDVLLIGPEHDVFWNPIHCPDLEPRVISGRVMAILENLSGEQGDSGKWIRDHTAQMLENSIGLIRLATNYVTLYDVDQLINRVNAELASAGERRSKRTLEDALDDIFYPMERMVPKEHKRSFAHHAAWFVKFAHEKPEIRSHFVMEAERILQYFTDPRYRPKYCPPIDKINFHGFRESCIRQGKLVALDATVEKYGPLANALGIFLKLEFQRDVLSRKAESRASGLNYKRPVFLFIDEYQEFVSAAGNFGDDQFLALSRESKAVNVFLTQGRVSLVSKLGETRTKVLLNSVRTKIFLGLEDADDRDYAAATCGQEWKMKESISVGEQVEAAVLTDGGQFVGEKTTVNESRSLQEDKRNRWEPTDFRDLPAFTAIVSAFDGTRSMVPERVYLKPYWVDRSVSHRDFMATWEDEKR